MWQVILYLIIHGVVWGGHGNVADWWETAHIYRIYTRSFMDSDGDGIGDINGITSKLQYLKELGVEAAWLSSIFKSPMHDFGYDISDYFAIDSEYGTMEDFEKLIIKANSLNIKILLDFVPNHTSNESEWFIKSLNKDEYYSSWYIWDTGFIDSKGEKQPPNNWISAFGQSAWSYVPRRGQYYLHQFGASQPDLNFRNPVVVDEIKNIMKFWLEKGIAGMCITAANYLFEAEAFGGRYPNEPKSRKINIDADNYESLSHIYTKDQTETYDLISQFREVFDSITLRVNLTRVLMIEANTGIKKASKYYGENIRTGAHIPVNFGLIEDVNKDSDARDIKYVVDRWLTYKPLRKPANWVTGSHDKSRVASRFRPELVDAFNMLTLLLPGIGITYMGEEIGMVNGFIRWTETKDPLACITDDPVNFVQVSRDPARTPFQWNNGKNAGFSEGERTWLPVADGYDVLNVVTQQFAVRSYYQVYYTLSNLRKRSAFQIGYYDSLALTKYVFAFKRWHSDDTYVVVINLGKSYEVVNLTAFDLIFGHLKVEASNVMSSRIQNDMVSAEFLELAAEESLVLRMQV